VLRLYEIESLSVSRVASGNELAYLPAIGGCMAKKTTSSGSKGKGKIKKVMEEHKEGKLKSGSGKKVTNRKQAIAIALSEARKSGAKIPKKKSKS
jgi:hypothetical protein